MANKKLTITGNKKLIIRPNTSFNIYDSTTSPKRKSFAQDKIASAFHSFIPELNLEYVQNRSSESSIPVMKISNIDDLKEMLSQYEYGEKDYTNYLETGIILIKHSRLRHHYYKTKRYKKLGLPKGASIYWNNTTYGRTKYVGSTNPLPVGRLSFHVDLDTGKILFTDYSKSSDINQKWHEEVKDTEKALIFEKIHPVSARPTNQEYTYLYRGQDNHDHNYYFYGVIFRLKRSSYIKTKDEANLIIGKPSSKTIPISYDIKDLQLYLLEPSEAMRCKELRRQDNQDETN